MFKGDWGPKQNNINLKGKISCYKKGTIIFASTIIARRIKRGVR